MPSLLGGNKAARQEVPRPLQHPRTSHPIGPQCRCLFGYRGALVIDRPLRGNEDNQGLTAKPFITSLSYTPNLARKRQKGDATCVQGARIRKPRTAQLQGNPGEKESRPVFFGLWRCVNGVP